MQYPHRSKTESVATYFLVGEGLAPPETPAKVAPTAEAVDPVVGEGLAPPENANPDFRVTIEDVVMMPDHVHQ